LVPQGGASHDGTAGTGTPVITKRRQLHDHQCLSARRTRMSTPPPTCAASNARWVRAALSVEPSVSTTPLRLRTPHECRGGREPRWPAPAG
jgi:hypothetical protein